jgi:P pilus assembly chaperone PapD
MLAAMLPFVAAALFAQTDPQTQTTSTQPGPAAPAATSAGTAGIADLLVAPPRLIFEGRQRSGELSLVNIGARPATYRITLVNIEMVPNGNLKQLDTAGPREVLEKSLVRYSPRQVTLEPHVAQSVRLELRKPADLAEGEYRVHILFQGVPPADATRSSVDPADASSNEIKIALIPVYGVSIPIFIRHGSTQATASISDAKIETDEQGQRVLSMTLNRKGNRSVYGNITASLVTKGGKPQVIALLNGIAVYPEIDSRPVKLAIRMPDGSTLAHGTIHVTYTDAERDDHSLLADFDLAVP